MKAIIKAILLDEEARDCAAQADDSFGKLREPFLRYMQLCLSFEASNVNGHQRNAMASIMRYFGQKPFTSPSVFNFFQSDYQPIGPVEEANLYAPEFQITNSQTIAGYMNALNRWLFFDQVIDDWGYGFDQEWDPNNQSRSKDLILEVLRGIELEGSDNVIELHRLIRVKMAVFLIMSNPEYLVNR